jgi:hypothetical protein
MIEKLDHLALQQEVCMVRLGAKPVLAAQLNVPDDSRHGVEHGLSIENDEAINVSKVHLLHGLD